MKKSSYRKSGTTSGITYTFSLEKEGKKCSFLINFNGLITETNPVLFVLPEDYRPLNMIRICGYPNNISSFTCEIIIHTSGAVQCSGSIGENKLTCQVGSVF